MKLTPIFQNARQWLFRTPERSLENAYQAAVKITAIEDEHFHGKPVASEFSTYSQSVLSYFHSEVNGYIQAIKMRLQEFKASRLLINLSNINGILGEDRDSDHRAYQNAQEIIDKLNFIDDVINRYKKKPVTLVSPKTEPTTIPLRSIASEALTKESLRHRSEPRFEEGRNPPRSAQLPSDMESMSEKNSVLPRSFLRTLNRIKQEIDPKSDESEEEVLKKFRESRYKTAISIKFVLTLIIVPILTHQLSKIAISPFVENYFSRQEQVVFINQDLEAEAFQELQHYEESLHFKGLIGLTPKMSSEEVELEVKEKATELAEDYRHQGVDAIENVFSDLFSILAFALVVFFNREQIAIVKSFLDSILYSLSDSAKAFLIILFTDMFVGFHSPHGWEILLEGVARHLGLPENREFNFLFIATFPVILDTVLKYWIFRYLNRISPSSVATYKNMNE